MLALTIIIVVNGDFRSGLRMSPARPELEIQLAICFPSWIDFINQLLLKVYDTDFLQSEIDLTYTSECCWNITSAMSSALNVGTAGLNNGAEGYRCCWWQTNVLQSALNVVTAGLNCTVLVCHCHTAGCPRLSQTLLYILEQSALRCSTLDPGLTHKCQTRQEKPDKYKHSSFLQTRVFFPGKLFKPSLTNTLVYQKHS